MNLLSNKKPHRYRSILSLAVFIGLGLIASGCQPNQSTPKASDNTASSDISSNTSSDTISKSNNYQRAIDIAKNTIITDTHIDVPYRLEEKFENVGNHTDSGDFDHPRAVAGGLDAPFMSIYIPAELEKSGGSKVLADKLIDMVEGLVKTSPNKFALAYSTQALVDNFSKGLISFPMGMENGSPIEGDFTNLTHFYQRGIRYITLTHSKANHISDSSYDTNRPAKGLTPFGKTLITKMNNIGVMVDVSHISDDAFYQVMEISKTPVIASHSSARHFTPGFERNMSDDMIKLLAKNGGVIQINFGSTFISQTSIENNNAFKAAVKAFSENNTLAADSDEVTKFSEEYRLKTPFVFANLDNVLDHFDHVVKLVGIDYVGIGSDYDGVGDSLPTDLKDVASYPNLIEGLLNRGYSEQAIKKILSGNLLRVWKAVEVYAEQH
ncbi:MAG: membrane dipeptidase [Alteromonadaceae bacterium]|jgi:membrane dipeptidase